MQPIPRIILIHDVTYERRTGTNADGKGAYATAVPVYFVRCEPIKSWVNAANGEMKDDKLTMFFDGVNSEPAMIDFKKGDRITFKSAAYTIRDIKDFYPHHLEIILK